MFNLFNYHKVLLLQTKDKIINLEKLKKMILIKKKKITILK